MADTCFFFVLRGLVAGELVARDTDFLTVAREALFLARTGLLGDTVFRGEAGLRSATVPFWDGLPTL